MSQAAGVLRVSVGGKSVAGVKPENQDAFAAHIPQATSASLKGAVACIADGVSSSEQAALASQTAVTTFISDYLSTPETWDVKTSVSRVLSSLNAWLYQQGHSVLVPQAGWVTTFSAMIIKSSTLYCFHVGDSRIYRLRDGQLDQLTRDHSMATRGGGVILTRALGMDSHLEVDCFQEAVKEGDLYLLTTDGVHEWLKLSERLAELPAAPGSRVLEKTAHAFVEAALAAGSQDNLSCLMVRVDALAVASEDEIQAELSAKVIPPELVEGNRIDHFRVERVIHNGPRSSVYLVRDEKSGDRLVLKCPSENHADDLHYLDSFSRESWVGQRVSHPGLVKSVTVPSGTRFLYQLYAYVEGQTLRQWMHDHPQPALEEVRLIVKGIVAALRALQRQGMVHRDLKPENVILDPEGRPIIIDYGAVLVAGLQEIRTPLTEDSVPLGSLDYIAPEYLLQNHATTLSDLFSLAAMIYEMIAGRLPFEFENLQSRWPKSFDRWVYRPMRERREDCPLWLDLAVQKALSPRPQQRYQAFSEFMADLETPNKALLAKHRHQPILERNPVRAWQCVSALLFVIVLVQFYYLAT
jgi:serine/threonine protein phosphatase PrpC/predicted Ser/Thr protein kinase